MSTYGTIVEVKRDDGESTERAMLICVSPNSPTAFVAIKVASPPGWGNHYLRDTAVRGLRGNANSMWSVREEK